MNSITLENFKVFKTPTKIDLGTITLLTGKNNSGKSSFIRALMFLSDFHSDGKFLVNDYNGENCKKTKINSGSDIVSSNSGSNIVSFVQEYESYRVKFKCLAYEAGYDLVEYSVELTKTEVPCFLSLTIKDDAFELTLTPLFFAIHSNIEHYRKWEAFNLSLIHVENKKREIAEMSVKDPNKEKLKLKNAELKKLQDDQEEFRKIFKSFYNKKPLIFETNFLEMFQNDDPGYNINLANYLEIWVKYQAEKRLKELKSKLLIDIHFYSRMSSYGSIDIDHTGPDRINMTRGVLLDSGEFGNLLVGYRKLAKEPELGFWMTEKQFVRKWLVFFDIGVDLKIEFIMNEVALVSVLKSNGEWVDLASMGFGSRQLVTLILKMYVLSRQIHSHLETDFGAARSPRMNRNIDFIVIEEPESNLHPNLQSRLADFFYEVVPEINNWSGIKIIIETHSEYLIRRTQVLIKEKGLQNNPFKVYYFDAEKGPYEMKYRDDGIFENDFGPGFFDEADSQAIRLLRKS